MPMKASKERIPKPKGRAPYPNAADRRTVKLVAYFTESESKAVRVLTTDFYEGDSDVIRQAVGFLITNKHPELIKYLREDLQVDKAS